MLLSISDRSQNEKRKENVCKSDAEKTEGEHQGKRQGSNKRKGCLILESERRTDHQGMWKSNVISL